MKVILKITAILAVLCTFILTSGCQSPGKVVSTQASTVCPQCEMQTVTSPIKGLTYTRCVCPTCKTVETDAEKVSAALASYTSRDMKTVHVCEHCKSVVESCAACSKM